MHQKQSLKQFILRDRKSENITEEVTVVLRCNLVMMCIYFLVLLLSFWISNSGYIVLFGILGFLAFMAAYYLCYRNQIKGAVSLTYIATVLYVIAFSYVFGRDNGVHYFLFSALILVLTMGFIGKKIKMALSISLGVLYVFLFFCIRSHEPVYVLAETTVYYLQVINTITVFGLIICCITVFSEQTQAMEEKLIMYNKKLTYLASEDPVTGLYNRRSILEYLDKITHSDDGEKGKKVNIALGDIDFFKKINDGYGHECGDVVLRQLSYQFQNFMSGKGRVSRWGGEEFLFVFYDMSAEDAYYYLTQLQNQIRNMEFLYKDESIHLTMTYGLTSYNYENSIDSVISEADKKLYMGKESGRNTIIF